MTTKTIHFLLFLLLALHFIIVVVFGYSNIIDDVDETAAVTDLIQFSNYYSNNIDNFTINNQKINNDDDNSHAVSDDSDNDSFIKLNSVTNKSTAMNYAATKNETFDSNSDYDVDYNGNVNKQKTRKLKRGKRYLDFLKGSRVSWRTTMKNNILKINTLWGHGWGFRSNFPFPDKKDRLRPFFKRDLLHTTVDMLDGHGLDGRACILKSYCTALLDGDTHIGGGMIFKLLKFVFNLDMHEKRHFPYLNLENCHQILHSHCPLSFDSISPYTDDV